MNIRSSYLAFSTLPLIALLMVSQSGCVALNVPSQRFHDPADGGGVLGGWSHRSVGRQPANHAEANHLAAGPHFAAGTNCVAGSNSGPNSESQTGLQSDIMGGALDVDPFDTSGGVNGQPKPPEIPWPRFHPIPTRPVFGTSSL